MRLAILTAAVIISGSEYEQAPTTFVWAAFFFLLMDLVELGISRKK